MKGELMKLKYSVVRFTIEFENGIYFKQQPHFQIRGILGANLKKIACFQRSIKCSECFLKENCAYSWLFETYIPKDNTVLQGRDRGSHPFFIRSVKRRKDTDIFDIDTVFIGKALDYIPYVFGAFEKAGRDGILKERYKYSIVSVKIGNTELLTDGNLSEPLPPEEFQIDTNNREEKTDKKININLITPLRLKKKGEIVENPGTEEIFDASFNRLNILCRMFGEYEDDLRMPEFSVKKEDKNLSWSDSGYYSSRQKKKIVLGGFKGEIKTEIAAEKSFFDILEYASVFNIGKNVSFGLGRFSMER